MTEKPKHWRLEPKKAKELLKQKVDRSLEQAKKDIYAYIDKTL